MKQFLILIVYSLLVNTLSFAQQYGEKVFTKVSKTDQETAHRSPRSRTHASRGGQEVEETTGVCLQN